VTNAVDALATLERVTTAQRIPLQILFVASLVDDKEPLAAIAIVDRVRRAAAHAEAFCLSRVISPAPMITRWC
jgi:hypothetical protein